MKDEDGYAHLYEADACGTLLWHCYRAQQKGFSKSVESLGNVGQCLWILWALESCLLAVWLISRVGGWESIL